jgi:hypothetical protein
MCRMGEGGVVQVVWKWERVLDFQSTLEIQYPVQIQLICLQMYLYIDRYVHCTVYL